MWSVEMFLNRVFLMHTTLTYYNYDTCTVIVCQVQNYYNYCYFDPPSHTLPSPSPSLPPSLAPSAVTNLVPTSNPFSICVQWAEPIDNGGQPIEQYRVELFNRDVYPTENYVFVTDLISSVMSYTIENLNNDTDYR